MSLGLSERVAVSPGADWKGSAAGTESTLHQISPYIGKLKSTIARSLIAEFTKQSDIVYDPFSGCGTIALEAWLAQRHAIAADLNPYAHALTRAKLFPDLNLEKALKKLRSASQAASAQSPLIDLRAVPAWVRKFFHPETLRETIALNHILRERRLWFLQACLLGILHHQRPGFLSYPSCHTVPYLRLESFPRCRFPALYDHRPVQCRLEAKVMRALRRVPITDQSLTRQPFLRDARYFVPQYRVDAIITSPPYMKRLDYGRDNRLRLWCLGIADWKSLDKKISPREHAFVSLMRDCFYVWKDVLRPGGRCVLILGDSHSRLYRAALPEMIKHIATAEVGGYEIDGQYTENIPDARRVRRGLSGNRLETILVLKRNGGSNG
jgi:hypothetical protein